MQSKTVADVEMKETHRNIQVDIDTGSLCNDWLLHNCHEHKDLICKVPFWYHSFCQCTIRHNCKCSDSFHWNRPHGHMDYCCIRLYPADNCCLVTEKKNSPMQIYIFIKLEFHLETIVLLFPSFTCPKHSYNLHPPCSQFFNPFCSLKVHPGLSSQPFSSPSLSPPLFRSLIPLWILPLTLQ